MGVGTRPQLSRLTRGFRVRVGRSFLERGRLREPTKEPRAKEPRAVVDKMSDLANTGIDTARIHPDIVRFFDDTSGLDLFIRSRWSFPFSIIFLLGRWILRFIGQFYLPRHNGDARIKTTAVAIDPDIDGREDVRGILRTYVVDGEETNDVMQVVLYATHRDTHGSRYMLATFPLPGGSVTGVLRVDPICNDEHGRLGVALTSRPRELPDGSLDDASVWLELGPLVFRAPLDERIEMWTPSMPGAPARDLDCFRGTTIVATHVQQIFGVTFATHHYWFRPAVSDREPPSRT